MRYRARVQAMPAVEKWFSRLLPRRTHQLDAAISFMIALIMAMCAYRLRLTLERLAFDIPDALGWFWNLDVYLIRMDFSDVAMMLAWPLIVAVLCIVCRDWICKQRVLLSPPKEKWTNPHSTESLSLLARELCEPFPRRVWAVFGAVPTVTLSLHIGAGILGLLLCNSAIHASERDQDYWLNDWWNTGMVMLVVCGATGLWFATQFRQSMKQLRETLLSCLPPEHAPGNRRSLLADN